jgi:hypothetical protein
VNNVRNFRVSKEAGKFLDHSIDSQLHEALTVDKISSGNACQVFWDMAVSIPGEWEAIYQVKVGAVFHFLPHSLLINNFTF